MNVVEDIYCVMAGHSAVVRTDLESGMGVLDACRISAAEAFIREQEFILETFINNSSWLRTQQIVMQVLESKLSILKSYSFGITVMLNSVNAGHGPRVFQQAVEYETARHGQKRSKIRKILCDCLVGGSSEQVPVTREKLKELIDRLSVVMHVTQSRKLAVINLKKFTL